MVKATAGDQHWAAQLAKRNTDVVLEAETAFTECRPVKSLWEIVPQSFVALKIPIHSSTSLCLYTPPCPPPKKNQADESTPR